ncbi:C40 family peptidase [Streptomyces sp. UH6]|uniref:C40 family peptidase n=1 Tax=Streptomyces sp. UH6 TaxID=2748379 RepID=UPI00211ED036|nr:C40 family peptidase [Streptomyces sp. UH6]
MAQQTLLPPPHRTRPKPQPSPRHDARPALRRHRKPRSSSARVRRFVWGAAGLAVAFVLSLIAGALLAVHGPTGSPSASRGPSVTLQQKPPATAGPSAQPSAPAPSDTGKEPKEKEKKKREGFEEVTLRPGDTLWNLARAHHTSVKALQHLNALGSSTLIYAGQTLKVPSGKTAADAAARPKTDRPAATAAPDRPSTPQTPKAVSGKPGTSSVIAYARKQLGKPYVWGGTGPRGFDCSGLVMRAWATAGVQLPRTTWGQIRAGSATTRARLVPGDLVLSYGGGHVGLYIGDGKVIHAPRPGTTITVAPLPSPGNVVAYRHIRA